MPSWALQSLTKTPPTLHSALRALLPSNKLSYLSESQFLLVDKDASPTHIVELLRSKWSEDCTRLQCYNMSAGE